MHRIVHIRLSRLTGRMCIQELITRFSSLPASTTRASPGSPFGQAGRNGACGWVKPSSGCHQVDLKVLGFGIITWTFERAALRQGVSNAGYYYDFDPTGAAIKKDSDMYKALDVLAREVKILGIFSDWPATVTYYANCMGLK